MNEGATTANTTVTARSPVGVIRTMDAIAPENPSAKSLTEARPLRLHPGDVCFAEIELECSAREWLEHAPIHASVDVVAGDIVQDGIEDHISFQIIASPLAMDPTDSGRAVLRPEGEKVQLTPTVVERTFRDEAVGPV